MIGDIDWEAKGESVLQPIGPLARSIKAMPFDDFAKLMIGLSLKEQKKEDARLTPESLE
jgi:hypothetical protein